MRNRALYYMHRFVSTGIEYVDKDLLKLNIEAQDVVASSDLLILMIFALMNICCIIWSILGLNTWNLVMRTGIKQYYMWWSNHTITNLSYFAKTLSHWIRCY